MSDHDSDEGEPAYKKPKAVYFGSLAAQSVVDRLKGVDEEEAKRLPKKDSDTGDGIVIGGAPKLETDGKADDGSKKPGSANVSVSNEYMELDKIQDPSRDAAMAEFDRRRRARQLTLPTDDVEVRMLLRQLDEAICLFGEDKPDRRERLKTLLSVMDSDEVHKILHRDEPMQQQPQRDEHTWYHEGSADLRDARLYIAKYSLPRAQQRLLKAREQRLQPAQHRAVRLQETHKWVRGVTNVGSQIGDNRPISFCEFSPNSQYMVTASWSGLCKLWTIPKCELVQTFRGHNSYAGCIRFHPRSTVDADAGALNLASCGHDGTVMLWSLDHDEPIADLEGHSARVSRLAFHPSGRFLATCCHDMSWRLFDLEVNEEVLFQEGHSKAVYDIEFQCDGSLALTGGMDSYGRVWDLRTGRCIMFLEGHQKEILTVDWAPTGYQMATGSADNSAKLWDLRMRRCFYTIPAHKNLVSSLKFDKTNGNYLLSGSYDNSLKMWCNPGWQQLRQLHGHDSKVMSVDISPCGTWLASTSYDRTFKLWANDTV